MKETWNIGPLELSKSVSGKDEGKWSLNMGGISWYISEELAQRFINWLDEKNQQVEHWKHIAGRLYLHRVGEVDVKEGYLLSIEKELEEAGLLDE